MPISDYLAGLRERVGHDLLLMPAAAAVIRDDHGRVLLQQRADDGRWCIPGGALDPGEQPAQACVREAFEETGLVVRPLRVLCVETHPVVTYPNGDVAQPVVTVFDCRPVGGRLGGRDGESVDLRFVAVDGVPGSAMLGELLRGLLAEPPEHAAFAWDDHWLSDLPR